MLSECIPCCLSQLVVWLLLCRGIRLHRTSDARWFPCLSWYSSSVSGVLNGNFNGSNHSRSYHVDEERPPSKIPNARPSLQDDPKHTLINISLITNKHPICLQMAHGKSGARPSQRRFLRLSNQVRPAASLCDCLRPASTAVPAVQFEP